MHDSINLLDNRNRHQFSLPHLDVSTSPPSHLTAAFTHTPPRPRDTRVRDGVLHGWGIATLLLEGRPNRSRWAGLSGFGGAGFTLGKPCIFWQHPHSLSRSSPAQLVDGRFSVSCRAWAPPSKNLGLVESLDWGDGQAAHGRTATSPTISASDEVAAHAR